MDPAIAFAVVERLRRILRGSGVLDPPITVPAATKAAVNCLAWFAPHLQLVLQRLRRIAAATAATAEAAAELAATPNPSGHDLAAAAEASLQYSEAATKWAFSTAAAERLWVTVVEGLVPLLKPTAQAYEDDELLKIVLMMTASATEIKKRHKSQNAAAAAGFSFCSSVCVQPAPTKHRLWPFS